MGKHLKNSLKYILNPEKTRMGTLISGNHILPDPEYAFQQMLDTKKVMDARHGYKKNGKGDKGITLYFLSRQKIPLLLRWH